MSGQPAKAKGSRWGSLLSGAVAGIESRLDTILAEDDQASVRYRKEEAEQKAQKLREKEATDNSSRNPSRTRANDRLQERLAKAVGTRTPEPSPSRPDTRDGEESNEKNDEFIEELAASTDLANGKAQSDATQSRERHSEDKTTAISPEATLLTSHLPINPQRVSIDSRSSTGTQEKPRQAGSSARTSGQLTRDSGSIDVNGVLRDTLMLGTTSLTIPTADHERIVADLSKAHQEESSSHLERIDALSSKLRYLSTTLTSSAEERLDGKGGSTDSELASRDLKIAALMEEGQKLSSQELKHLTLIKRLREKIGEDTKRISTTQTLLVQLRDQLRLEREKKEISEMQVKSLDGQLKVMSEKEGKAQNWQLEKEGMGGTISGLRADLDAAVKRAEEAESRFKKQAMEMEQLAAERFQEQLEDAKIQKQLVEDRGKLELKRVSEERDSERRKSEAVQSELRLEISNLESKIELLRSRTEEVSSGGFDNQAKLLRQIETLQGQYNVASDNWNGIETTLNTRIAALERERDDIAKRESDIRRKAREISNKSRTQEQELEASKEQSRSLEADIESIKAQALKIQASLDQADRKAQETLRAELERARQKFAVELAQQLDQERAKTQAQLQELHDTHGHQKQNSMIGLDAQLHRIDALSRKHSTPDSSRRGAGHSMVRGLSSDLPVPNRPHSRRTSGLHIATSSPQPPAINGFPLSTPTRADTSPSFADLNGTISGITSTSASATASVAGSLSASRQSSFPVQPTNDPRTPSIHTPRGAFDGDGDTLSLAGAADIDDPASPTRRSTVADMLSASASTLATGPSVALVERMSAAVRRLESEKASLRDEIGRLTGQRDEARSEVVKYMTEMDEKPQLEARLKTLEEEKASLEERFNGALEMAGEKSERCEELMADVQDLKKMYRELVDSTMK